MRMRRITLNRTARLAETALKKMEKFETYQDCFKTGDKFLAAIEEDGAPAERLIAQYTREAASAKVTYLPSANICQKCALKMLAGGIKGPVSVALSNLGDKVMSEVREGKGLYVSRPSKVSNIFKDAREMGEVFLKGVSANSTDYKEKVIADTVIEASDKCNDDSGKDLITQTALKTLASGVKGPIGVALANFGHKILQANILLYKDSRAVGETFLESVKNADMPQGNNNNEKLFADIALKASNAQINEISSKPYKKFDLVSRSRELALKMIKDGIGSSTPPEKNLAKFGGELNYNYLTTDNDNNYGGIRKIGVEVLKGIRDNTLNSLNVTIAKKALSESNNNYSDVLDNKKAAIAQLDAFKSIERS